jgi:hypothetical protein
MEHIVLSILICHLLDRKDILHYLYNDLKSQCINLPVEIIVAGDNGEISIGTKRNKLLFEAKGEYIAFVDDDDSVSPDYISSIIKALESKPDCVGIEGVMQTNLGDAVFKHSIEYQGWYTGADAYYRTPNHLNPIKKTIAQAIGFPDMMFGEDQRYSEALRRSLSTEVYIDHPIYFYKKEFQV